MTFIASVIAQEGVAIVADSFVTTEDWMMEWDDFSDYVSKKSTSASAIDIDEIKQLFQRKPIHTRNYTEKLFKFDVNSAITTAGRAYMNDKPIKQIINEISGVITAIPNYTTNPIEQTLDSIKDLIKAEAISHINKYGNMESTVFIFSHFNQQLIKPQIFKIKIDKTKIDEITPPNTKDFVTYNDETSYGIVTDGQDIMIDRLLFGSLYKNSWLQYLLAAAISKEMRFKKKTRDKIVAFLRSKNLWESAIKEEINYIKRRPLSLQEAVEFAALLVRVVINIQAYTEKIPTVGGVIKLAVIDKNGFNNISGHEIIKPSFI